MLFVKAFLKSGVKFGSVFRRIEDKLLVVELSVLHDVFGKRKEQYGTRYDKDDFNNWEKDDIEKTHIYFCKQFLGVNKQCPNAATRNKLGRLPLNLAIES